MKVWLVWKGCYSDVRVVAVCSSRERAEAIVRKNNELNSDKWDDLWLDEDEYEIDSMDADGISTDYIRVISYISDGKLHFEHYAASEKEDDRFNPMGRTYGERNVFITTIQTGDVEKALKVASERRAQHLYKLVEEGRL